MNTLYLTRSTTHRGHVQLNVRLLSDPIGSNLVFSIAAMSLTIPVTSLCDKSANVVMVVNEVPDVELPLRLGWLEQAVRRPNFLELTVRLGKWLRIIDPEAWGSFLKTHRPPGMQCFLGPMPAGVEAVEELPDRDWDEVARHMAQCSRYSDTVFVRPGPVLVRHGKLIIPLRFCNPHLPSRPNAEIQVVSVSQPEVILARLPAGLEGTAEMDLEITPPQQEVRIIVHPSRLYSPQWHLILPDIKQVPLHATPLVPGSDQVPEGTLTRVTESSTPALIPTSLPTFPHGWLQRLVVALRRHMHLMPDSLISIIEDHLLPLWPDEVSLKAALGTALASAGRYENAYEVLRHLPLGSLDEAALIATLRAGTHVGGDISYEEIIPLLDLGRDDRITQLVECISALGDVRGPRLLVRIIEEDPPFDEAGIVALLLKWKDNFTQPYAICKVAYYLGVFLGPQTAYEYLCTKWRSNEKLLASSEFCQAAIEFAMSCGSSPDTVEEVLKPEFTRVVSTGDMEGWERLRRAGRLLPMRNLIRILELALEHPSEGDQMQFNVLLELVRLLRSEGFLEEAAHYVLKATALASKDAEAQALVKEERERIELALRESKVIQEYLQASDEFRINQLRTRLAGRVVMVVGGWRPGWAEQLRLSLALEKLDWRESEPGQRLDTKPILEALKTSKIGVMVIIWDHKGHAGEDKLTERARAVGTKIVRSVFGYRSLLAALYNELINEPSSAS